MSRWRQRLEKRQRVWRSNYANFFSFQASFNFSFTSFVFGFFSILWYDDKKLLQLCFPLLQINKGADSISKSFRIVIQKKKQLILGKFFLMLMTDVFENYVIQKVCSYLTLCLILHCFETIPYLFDHVSVFECGNPSRRNELADQLIGQIEYHFVCRCTDVKWYKRYKAMKNCTNSGLRGENLF